MPDQEQEKEKDTSQAADDEALEECRTTCRTNALVDGFSICLVKNRFCEHALAFGHQFLCRHPHHAKFAVSQKKKK
ncbi:hypothetical protein E4633_01615 [Geomonas terrae]|uniref:Uncharacterized protein n=1 Tax=Geomonas terrae TaxID=2562681 RepID=A0A4V3P047_9BACT|nr:hypothetical protein [Geomonas terrae]TGU74192.1 hypothetical protein E4633_01615 [Geomonas terrae]